MNVRWVGQEDNNGCGIACLAMITGKSYIRVRDEFLYYRGSKGLDNTVIDEYLADNGFAVARKFEVARWKNAPHERIFRSEDWTKPFADIHIVQVTKVEPKTHYVIMLRDGTVLDPLMPTVSKLEQYSRVWNIAAVVPIDRTKRKVSFKSIS